MIKSKYLIPTILFIGVAVLYFFPEPEENFLLYIVTLLVLVVIVILLTLRGKKEK